MNEATKPLITALTRDVFFGMRIRTILNQLGYQLKLVDNELELEKLSKEAVLALVDMNRDIDWDQLAPLLEGGVPTIAFASHTYVDAFRAAKAAGVNRTVSNGELSRNLPKLVEQYRRP